MCVKLPYENPRIDKCMVKIIEKLRSEGVKTLSCCCGHGVYPRTIVVKDDDGQVREYFSQIVLDEKKHNQYYRKDENGYYFIPGLETR